MTKLKSTLGPFAKAIASALFTLIAVLAYSLSTGKFDRTSITMAAVGLIGAVVTYFVPNAAGEVQAAEAVFSPVAAGHPDPVPPPSVLPPDPAPPAPPPTTPPAA